MPSTSHAYYGWTAQCYNYQSAQACWVGNGYHSIVRVRSQVWSIVPSEMCAKGRTAAGNIRSGSGCNYNTANRDSSFGTADPASAGYGYWGGSQSSSWGTSVSVYECSPADVLLCNRYQTPGTRG